MIDDHLHNFPAACVDRKAVFPLSAARPVAGRDACDGMRPELDRDRRRKLLGTGGRSPTIDREIECKSVALADDAPRRAAREIRSRVRPGGFRRSANDRPGLRTNYPSSLRSRSLRNGGQSQRYNLAGGERYRVKKNHR